MTEFCYLCDRFVEVNKNEEIWRLEQPGDREFNIICDRCVNKTLHFGEPRRGGCLFCKKEPEYNLRKYGVSLSTSGFHYHGKIDTRPIICESHLKEIREPESQVLSIEDTLIDEDQLRSPDIHIPEAIGEDEDQHLEYKETFQYNTYTDEKDDQLKLEVANEIAAFGNSEGGVLVIGVRDEDKKIMGLERDYQLVNKGWDDIELQIGGLVSGKIGDAFTASCTTIERHQVENEDVCVIRVDPSPNPLFTEDSQFYVRQGSHLDR